LPSGVVGPVDFWELRRLAAICFWVAMGRRPFDWTVAGLFGEKWGFPMAGFWNEGVREMGEV
jgi:hypothetical protein